MKNHYRFFLVQELQQRERINPQYTLRAFALALNLDSGTLSQILKGKRKLPKSHWLPVAKKLKLNKAEKQIFLQSLWDEQGVEAKKNYFNDRAVQILTPENYHEIMTDWEFAAALCLFDIKTFEFTVQNIAKSLGLIPKRANEIYAKLFQYGLVKIIDNKIVRSENNFESTDDIPSKTLQMAHINVLELAKTKIQELAVLEREFISLTFSGNEKEIKKMKTWIKEKSIEFERIFESKKADRVFQFSLQLFPLSNKVTK